MRTGACNTDKSIDTRPSCEGNEPTVLTSSADIILPSMTPVLISKASCSFAKPAITFAGATTSSVEVAIAVGPVKKSFKPSIPACSAARRTIVFLYTLYSTPASRNCERNSVTSATVKPR